MEPAPDRRTELLAKIVDALLADGVAELSLRPLAERVGTSARLLIYHFETKENLIACALAEVRLRVERALREHAARERPVSLRASLLMFWDWAIAEPNQRYFRLLFEVDGLSMYGRLRLSTETRRDGPSVWLSLIDKAAMRLPRDEGLFSARSTLIMGALNGLLQDFLSTGDRARTTAALVELIEHVGGDYAQPQRGR
jgi:AcrR family transcriptional regulator